MSTDRSTRSACIDARALPTYALGGGHPWAPDRQLGLLELCETSGLLRESDFLATAPASREELLTVHHEGYVAALAALDGESPTPEAKRRGVVHGLGSADNPVHPGQYRAACAIAGATRDLVRALMRNEIDRGFQPTGGLHHAMPDAASGFCLVNDLALGIRLAREMGAKRVAYVDFDVHHGDGVERSFRDDPNVLTVSDSDSAPSWASWPATVEATPLDREAQRKTVASVTGSPSVTRVTP